MFKKFVFLTLLCFSPNLWADGVLSEWWNAPKYNWVAGGYSQDIQETGTRGLLISGGRFPVKTGFGFQSYLEATKLADPKDDGMVYTLGIEPVFKWNWAYVGLGMAVSDRATAVSGTQWNFEQTLGGRWMFPKRNLFLDLALRHRSHCSRCGVEEDKVNTGMTSLNFQVGFTF